MVRDRSSDMPVFFFAVQVFDDATCRPCCYMYLHMYQLISLHRAATNAPPQDKSAAAKQKRRRPYM